MKVYCLKNIMFRPCLRDLLNQHNPTEELNNNHNNNNNSTGNNSSNNNNNDNNQT